MKQPAPAALTATLEFAPAGDNAWSLTAVISNPGSAAVDATYAAPWVPAGFSATDAAGKRLGVTQPAFDTPVQEKTVHLEAGARAKILSAVTLRFREPAAATSGGLVWTIEGAHAPVTIACDVTLEGQPPIRAEAKL